MGSASSNDAIRNINEYGTSLRTTVQAPKGKASDEFGSLTFNEEVQRARLPKDVFRSLRRASAHGEALDPIVADIVASALKDWAVEHGATHYTHWFQPMTGITAEKHDASSPRPPTAAPSPSSAARNWSTASRTRRASPRAACARPSRPAATPPGTRPARRGC